ncbi:MAG: hypothetical protein LUO93_03690 [Methanomicrobiales archaeon]|nr:hypothetical protein [Methanomicrobiales archaeon]
MEPDTKEFAGRMEKEIERLRSLAGTLKGADRHFIQTIAEVLEQECLLMANGHLSQFEKEQEHSSAVLIEMLNRIELRVNDLAASLQKEQAWPQSRESADRIVHQFFVDCQDAERLIKHYEKRGYITQTQMGELQNQLRTLVHTMVGLFRSSENLREAIIQTFETRIFS